MFPYKENVTLNCYMDKPENVSVYKWLNGAANVHSGNIYHVPPNENGIYSCIREYAEGDIEYCNYNVSFQEDQRPILLVTSKSEKVLFDKTSLPHSQTTTSTTPKSKAYELSEGNSGTFSEGSSDGEIVDCDRSTEIGLLDESSETGRGLKRKRQPKKWRDNVRKTLKNSDDEENRHLYPDKIAVQQGEFHKQLLICIGDRNSSLSFELLYKVISFRNDSKLSLNKTLMAADNRTFYCEAYNEINNKTVPLTVNVLSEACLTIGLPLNILIMIAAGNALFILILTISNVILCKSRNRNPRKKVSDVYDDSLSEKLNFGMFRWSRNCTNEINDNELNASPSSQITSFFPEPVVPGTEESHLYELINESEDFKWKEINENEIAKLEVHNMEYLNDGNFAIVYQGKCHINDKCTKKQTVAVKIPKDFVNWTNPMNKENEFFLELQLHYRLPPHVNVIRCFGMSVSNGATGMVLEYAGNGTLKNFLQLLYKKDVKKIVRKDDKCIENLNIKCLKFAKEVASGMSFIAKNKIIHRDLAARNILMAENDVCKISDLGLARLVYSSSEYKMKSNDTIPIRWLAPESFFFRTYSEKSDVWSFGILLWEIIALGGTPYHDKKTGADVRDALESGYRMAPPKHCSHDLYCVMKHCWEENPDNRPTFSKLEKNLSQYLSHMKNHINFKDFDSGIYENISLQIYREQMIVDY